MQPCSLTLIIRLLSARYVCRWQTKSKRWVRKRNGLLLLLLLFCFCFGNNVCKVNWTTLEGMSPRLGTHALRALPCGPRSLPLAASRPRFWACEGPHNNPFGPIRRPPPLPSFALLPLCPKQAQGASPLPQKDTKISHLAKRFPISFKA